METRLTQLEAELEANRRELQAAHEKQRAGDDVFRRFSDSGILGIAVFELSGKVVLANEALLRMIGSPAEEVAAGKLRWDQLTPPEWTSRTAEANSDLKDLLRRKERLVRRLGRILALVRAENNAIQAEARRIVRATRAGARGSR